jgi:hypothetical protein
MIEPFESEVRVYTDGRFPSLKIVNRGDTWFTVYEEHEDVDHFRGIESSDSEQVSEPFAQRRAKAYFNALEANNSQRWADVYGDPTLYSEPEKPAQPSEPAEDVDALIAAARAETDPVKAQEMRTHALRLMSRESVAQQLVKDLLAS